MRGWSRPRSGSDGRLLRAKALTDRAEHKLETAVTSTPVLVPLDPIEREGRAVAGHGKQGKPVSPCGRGCPLPQSSPRQLGHDTPHRDVPLARKRARRLENLIVDIQGRSHIRYTSIVMRRCHKGDAREISVSNLVRFIPVGILR